MEVNRSVVGARNHSTVPDHDRADGDFLLSKTSLSFTQSAPHEQLILAGREVSSSRPDHQAMLARLPGTGGQFVRPMDFRRVVARKALRG